MYFDLENSIDILCTFMGYSIPPQDTEQSEQDSEQLAWFTSNIKTTLKNMEYLDKSTLPYPTLPY